MRALSNMGSATTELGNYPKALKLHQQSLTLAQQLQLPQDEATALRNLADVYIQLGQHQTALDLQQQHLELAISLHPLAIMQPL